jgi:Mg-chelatase subunit ChlD
MNQIEPTLLRIPRIRLVSHWLFVLSVGAALFFKPSSPAGAQESSVPTYHSATSEVRVVFFASDKNNHPIQELQVTDFVVVDDENVLRDYLTFTGVDRFDLDVVVLMDFSGSILPYLQEEIAEVSQLISLWSWNAGDCLSVLSFNGTETRLLCTGNCRSSLSRERLTSVPNGGPTPLFDALASAADLIIQHRRPDMWPVIVLFSDGDDTISKTPLRTLWEKLLMSGAQVYSIEVSARDHKGNGTAVLRKLAENFGGRVVPISNGALAIVNDLADDLHSAHMVTYAPLLSASDFHSIRILPSHGQKWKFRHRCGYYRPRDSP